MPTCELQALLQCWQQDKHLLVRTMLHQCVCALEDARYSDLPSQKSSNGTSKWLSADTMCVCRTENERNRRRDLVNVLKSRREQMLQSLRRDQNSANR